MTVVYRLVRAEHAADAFSGEGARLYGGRWNPAGYPVVYASQSRALAALETFVHLTLEAPSMQFLLYEITLPKGARSTRYRGSRVAWRHARVPLASQRAGLKWLQSRATLTFVVPSVIIPQETNYVLDVRHPQFAHLKISRPEPFSFDQRLWKS